MYFTDEGLRKEYPEEEEDEPKDDIYSLTSTEGLWVNDILFSM